MFLTVLISLAIAMLSGVVLFSGGSPGAGHTLDVVFGLSVSFFVGSFVALVMRHVLAALRFPEDRADEQEAPPHLK